MNIEEPEVNLTLSVDKCNLLLETLLFSASVDICADWKDTNLNDMVSLAKEIKRCMGNKVSLDNVYLYTGLEYEDIITDDIKKGFKKYIKIEKSPVNVD